MTVKEILKEYRDIWNLKIDDTIIERYAIYYNLLLSWNEKVNLTRIVDPHDFAVKHIIDSLSCLQDDIFHKNCSVIDVGTGAGFPGIPVKIYRSDIQLTLADSLNKRINFLIEAIKATELENVFTVHGRAEDLGKNSQYREKYFIAVSRAVARLNVLCELCLPLVQVGGYFVAMKGAQFDEEIDEAQNAIKILGGEIHSVKQIKLPLFDDRRAIVYIKKVQKTPSIYPRRAGTPEKKPL